MSFSCGYYILKKYIDTNSAHIPKLKCLWPTCNSAHIKYRVMRTRTYVHIYIIHIYIAPARICTPLIMSHSLANRGKYVHTIYDTTYVKHMCVALLCIRDYTRELPTGDELTAQPAPTATVMPDLSAALAGIDNHT